MTYRQGGSAVQVPMNWNILSYTAQTLHVTVTNNNNYQSPIIACSWSLQLTE